MKRGLGCTSKDKMGNYMPIYKLIKGCGFLWRQYLYILYILIIQKILKINIDTIEKVLFLTLPDP